MVFYQKGRKGQCRGSLSVLHRPENSKEDCSICGGMEHSKEDKWELLPKGMPVLHVKSVVDM